MLNKELALVETASAGLTGDLTMEGRLLPALGLGPKLRGAADADLGTVVVSSASCKSTRASKTLQEEGQHVRLEESVLERLKVVAAADVFEALALWTDGERSPASALHLHPTAAAPR